MRFSALVVARSRNSNPGTEAPFSDGPKEREDMRAAGARSGPCREPAEPESASLSMEPTSAP